MEKYGFVYIWRDRGKDRYYIGCHWGREDDGYICSSNWMRMSYKRRPKDFRRKIIKHFCTNEEMLNEEFRWLQMIKKEELGKKYYNFRNCRFSNNYNKTTSEESKMKNSLSHKGKIRSKEHCINISIGKKGHPVSSETKEKISKSLKGCIPWNKGIPSPSPMEGKTHSKESKEKIRESSTGNKNSLGKHHSDETKEKIREKRSKQIFSEETKKKMSESRKRYLDNKYIIPF